MINNLSCIDFHFQLLCEFLKIFRNTNVETEQHSYGEQMKKRKLAEEVKVVQIRKSFKFIIPLNGSKSRISFSVTGPIAADKIDSFGF